MIQHINDQFDSQKLLILEQKTVYLLGKADSTFGEAYKRYYLLKNIVSMMNIIFNCK